MIGVYAPEYLKEEFAPIPGPQPMVHCPPAGDFLNFIFRTVGTGTPISMTPVGIVALAEIVAGSVGSKPNASRSEN